MLSVAPMITTVKTSSIRLAPQCCKLYTPCCNSFVYTHQHIIQQLLHVAAVEANTATQVHRHRHVVALIDVRQRQVAGW